MTFSEGSMPGSVPQLKVASNNKLPKVPFARKTCKVSLVETTGQRIKRLRTAKGWSLTDLAAKLTEAIKRKKPFTRETVRKWEAGMGLPNPSTRLALSLVFQRPESEILYGTPGQSALQTVAAKSSTGDLRQLTAREDILLDLFAGLLEEQREHLMTELRAQVDANRTSRRFMGKTPLFGARSERVAAAYGPVPAPSKKKAKKKKKATKKIRKPLEHPGDPDVE